MAEGVLVVQCEPRTNTRGNSASSLTGWGATGFLAGLEFGVGVGVSPPEAKRVSIILCHPLPSKAKIGILLAHLCLAHAVLGPSAL